MSEETIDQNVTAVFIDALLYGVYFTTLLHCIRWLLFADEGWKLRRKKDIRWSMLLATLLLFFFSLANLALQFRSILAVLRTVERENKIVKVQKPPWVNLVLCTNANLSILIGDLVMMHRCWLICNKSRRVLALPVLLFLGGVLLTILQAYLQIVQGQHILGVWQPINSTVGPGTILTPFWGVTILLNAYTSGFIIYRIWRVTKDSPKYGASTSQIRFVMRVLIESGVMYFSTTVAHFVVWWTPNNFAISLISLVNLQIIGITFNLIFIRTSRRRVDGEGPAEFDDVNLSRMQFANNQTALETKTIGLNLNESYQSSNGTTVFVPV